MPNWCQNRLSIESDDIYKGQVLIDFKQFLDNLSPDQGFFKTLVPYPARLERKMLAFEAMEDKKGIFQTKAMVKKKGAKDYREIAHNWRRNNWGTKWDVPSKDIFMERDDVPIILTFETANAPPIKGIRHASKKFPDAIFDLSYYEGGDAYCGYSQFKNGVLIKEEYHNPCDFETAKDLGFDVPDDEEEYDEEEEE